MNHLPRRTALAAVAAVTGLVLSACGSSPAATEESQAGSTGGSFSWTDARGEKVQLAEKPDSVVAQSSVAAALWDAGFKVRGVYGELGELDGRLNYQAGNLDLDEVTVLGKTYGEFDEVAYARLDPDLLLDFNMVGKDLWYVPAEKARSIYSIAPEAAVKGQRLEDAETVIEDMVALAEELGADVDSPEHQRARDDFGKATSALGEAARGREDVKVALMSMNDQGLYVWDPMMFPEARTLMAAGVRFVKPKNVDETGWSEQLSWEQASTYHADVILSDARTEQFMAQVEKIPTYQRLPAVRAGQVYEWKTAAPYSYAQYGPIFADIAGWLKDAKKLN